MKLQILSDLHLEFFNDSKEKIKFLESLKTDVDYVLSAGDITSSKYVEEDYNLMCDVFGNVIFVAGNHEYYGSNKLDVDKRLSKIKGIKFLNDNFIEFSDYIILGGVGWHQTISKDYIYLNDFYQIQDLKMDKRYSYFWHNQTYEYFESMLNLFKNKKIICLTHNAPLLESILEQYKDDRMNCFFANDWSSLFKYNPVLWVYGHSHGFNDFIYENTRCIENSYGYNKQKNNKFIKKFIVNI